MYCWPNRRGRPLIPSAFSTSKTASRTCIRPSRFQKEIIARDDPAAPDLAESDLQVFPNEIIEVVAVDIDPVEVVVREGCEHIRREAAPDRDGLQVSIAGHDAAIHLAHRVAVGMFGMGPLRRVLSGEQVPGVDQDQFLRRGDRQDRLRKPALPDADLCAATALRHLAQHPEPHGMAVGCLHLKRFQRVFSGLIRCHRSAHFAPALNLRGRCQPVNSPDPHGGRFRLLPLRPTTTPIGNCSRQASPSHPPPHR